MTGNLLLQDNIQVQVGTGGDLKLYHNGTDSFIENQTGILKIQSSVVDGNISFLADNGSGTPTEYFRLNGDNTDVIFSKPIELEDNVELRIGSSGADLRILHNATNSYIQNYTGDLEIQQEAADKDILFRCDDGSGGLATYFYLDGSGTRTIFEKLTRYNDSVNANFGTDSDLRIYHDSSNSYIEQSTSATGDLIIQQKVDDKDIIFKCDDGSGGVTEYFRLDGSDADGTYTYTRRPDGGVATFGGDQDLRIWHEPSNNSSYIRNYTNDFYIENLSDDKDILFRCDDGSGGVETYFFLDGSQKNIQSNVTFRILDTGKLQLGNGADLEIFHDSSNTYLENYTGNFIFTQALDDGDMIFKCDNGSGGTTAYLTLDGSLTQMWADKDLQFSDSIKAKFGASSDLQIYHNGSNSYIEDTGTGDFYLQTNGTNMFLRNGVSGNSFIAMNTGNDDVSLRYGGSEKLSTTSSGATITGALSITGDGSNAATLTESGSGDFTIASVDDLRLDSGGNDVVLRGASSAEFGRLSNDSNNFIIKNITADKDIIFQADNGSGGVATYFFLDGSNSHTNFQLNARWVDNSKAQFGNSADLQIYHNGTNSYMSNSTGDFYIEQLKDDGDIIFKSDDGSGGTAEYFRLDGGNTNVLFSQNLVLTNNKELRWLDSGGTERTILELTNADDLYFGGSFSGSLIFVGGGSYTERFRINDSGNVALPDNGKLLFGAGSDLEIYHDGSHSYIKDGGTGNLQILATNLQINNSGNTQNMITASDGGAVTLYTAGNAKLATTSSGVDVTGRMAINDGNFNILLGDGAGDALSSGTRNVAVGHNALSTEDGHGRNVAIGHNSLFALNAGADAYNVAVGYDTGVSMTTGIQNTLIGALAGDSLAGGSQNVAVGMYALSTEDTHGKNVAVGYSALVVQNAGADAYNVAVGYNAGGSVSTGVRNVIVGGTAGDALTTGNDNTSLGHSALGAENTGAKNTAIGSYALASLDYNGDGHNTAVGFNAGLNMSTGMQNTILGSLAGDAITDGDSNIVIGYDSGGVLTEGGQNTLVGDQAAGALTTGGENTYIGRRSGSNATTGSNNLSIGAGSSLSSATVSNEANIFNGSVVARFQGAASAWTFVSDERDKKDIEDLELGLDFIDKLKPRKFKWDLRDSDTDKGKESSGFIAQEIKEVLDETGVDYTGIVDTNNPDQYTVAQANIIPMLVKAIQELKQEIQQLKNK
jgi:hypothetical protein